ncbi:DUF3775 domain-containing protein [Nostoc sp.]|uniref:DUF3775 domain-containing protein n=1 Tax=Nostoc sp. TaxID=1180 RepID=UPI002FFB88ED
MILLSINKIYKIIETAELIYGSMGSGRTNQPETFIDKLSYYLEDLNIIGRCSVNILYKYIDKFSEDEKAEVIALMWFGRSALDGQPEDFPNLVKQVVQLYLKIMQPRYIIEKPLLAKYLRSRLQKINISTCASS